MTAALTASPTWLWIYAAASSVLILTGGVMVGLAYLFVVALTPVLARSEPHWACGFFIDVDRAKQASPAKFAVPFAVCAVLAVVTAALAAIGQLWVSAAGAVLFLAAVPVLTLTQLVPLTRTMAALFAAPVTERAACATAVRRWGVVNVWRFWGGTTGLALVVAGTWLPALGVT